MASFNKPASIFTSLSIIVPACIKPCSSSLARVFAFVVTQYLKSASRYILPIFIKLSEHTTSSRSGKNTTEIPTLFSSYAICFVCSQVEVFGPLLPGSILVLYPSIVLIIIALSSFITLSKMAFFSLIPLASLTLCKIFAENGSKDKCVFCSMFRKDSTDNDFEFR